MTNLAAAMYATTATYRPEEMEGRSYDPTMSSFLSVDAHLQDPSNAQGFNRYSYCLNNPLRFVDPSGWLYLGASRSQESEFNRYRRYANASMAEEQWANRGIDRVILATIRLGVGLEMTPFMMGEVRKGGGGSKSQTGPSQAMQQVAGGEILLKDFEKFKMNHQNDQRIPMQLCKYYCLEAIGKYFGLEHGMSFYKDKGERMIFNNKDTTVSEIATKCGFDVDYTDNLNDAGIVTANLNAGNPIMLIIGVNGQNLHAVVVTGYRELESGPQYHIANPDNFSRDGWVNKSELDIKGNYIFTNPKNLIRW